MRGPRAAHVRVRATVRRPAHELPQSDGAQMPGKRWGVTSPHSAGLGIGSALTGCGTMGARSHGGRCLARALRRPLQLPRLVGDAPRFRVVFGWSAFVAGELSPWQRDGGPRV